MANDKIVNLAADWMFKAIEAWQSGDGHPLTCGNDSDHILVGKSKRIPGMDIPILACPECDYEQENVPCVVFTSYLRKEVEIWRTKYHKEWQRANIYSERLLKQYTEAISKLDRRGEKRQEQNEKLQRVRDCAEKVDLELLIAWFTKRTKITNDCQKSLFVEQFTKLQQALIDYKKEG
jgi:hypothetical protein